METQITYGALSLIPVGVTIILAIIMKKTFEPLILGAVTGFVILGGSGFFGLTMGSIYAVMADEILQWLFIIVFLWGCILALLRKSGGVKSFAEILLKRVKSERGALIVTWLFGVLLFFDDYLNVLVVGSTMSTVTDKYKIPREMLAYIADSTAAPMAIIIPISTWGIFGAGLLESVGVAEAGQGVIAYLASVPFIFYCWVAVLIVPLVALGVIPKIGPMKRAYSRAKEKGILAPPGSEGMSLFSEISEAGENNKSAADSFLLPLLLLVFLIIYSGGDAVSSLVITVVFTIIYYMIRKYMNFSTAMEACFDGVKGLVPTMAILFGSFFLIQANEGLGLTDYIIVTVEPLMSGALLPAVAFLALSLVAFATGSFWGLMIISLPIVIPLATAMGVNPFLAASAVWSAAGFGSHACFYGDATVMASAASGCNNIDHALTQIPYAVIGAAVAFVAYVITGYIMF